VASRQPSQQSLSCWFSRSYSQSGGGDEYYNSATAFEKLKLVEAGQRFANSATLTGTGDSGLYWSASVMVLTLRASASTTAASVLAPTNARGRSVRCLKD
jgi:hypothetical protein